jgi:acetyltransferase-like isoleucine patch superfamily enzyme
MIYKLIVKFYEYLILKLTRLEFIDILVNKYNSSKPIVSDKLYDDNFKHLGLDVNIPPSSFINNAKYISIGDNFGAWQNFRLEAINSYAGQLFEPEIIIGNNVSIGSDCHIGCINKIIIGDNVLMAGRIFITDHFHGKINSEDIDIAPAKRPLHSKGPVIIMDNVWIGEGVSIMPGVIIGKNSIIGANSVVTKNVSDNCVVAGNPAKLIRNLSKS